MKKFITQLVCVILLLFSATSFSQRAITGTVSDAKTGEKLQGVVVGAKGTNVGTTTDVKGSYTISVPSNATTLVFSLVGMITQEIILGSENVVNITLSEDVVGINEVVVTAVGQEKSVRSLGYSTQSVSGVEIKKSGESNVIQALSGKAAGVIVTGSGGTPGASSRIILRGNSTFTGENEPLIVVDGIPIDNTTTQTTAGDYPFNSNLAGVNNSNRGYDINPDDVESITILKGPAAAALYGVRAGAGAIIITTKKGKAGTKGFSATFSTSVGFDVVNKLPDLQLKYGQGSGGGTLLPGNIPKEEGTFLSGTPNSWGKIVPTPVDNVKNFFKTGVSYDNSLSIGSGTETSNVRLSIANLTQGGVVPNSSFNRTTARVNAETKITKVLKVGAMANFIQSGGTRVQNGSNLSGVMLSLLRSPSSFDLKGVGSDGYKNPDGTQRQFFSSYDNTYWSVYQNPFTDDVNRLLGNFYATYLPVSWLEITYRVGVDNYSDVRKQIFAVGSLAPANAPGGEIDENALTHEGFYSDLLLKGTKQLTKELGATLLIGNNLVNNFDKDQYQRGRDLSIPNFYNLSNATNLYSSESNSRIKSAAWFGNLDLNYKDYLYLTLTGREEWSSTLAKPFFFPSASLSFVFTDLMKKNDLFSYGKLRLSYARAGITPPAYVRSTYYESPFFSDGFTNGNNFPYLGQNGSGQSVSLGNKDLKPEINTGMEVGLDLKFLKNRLGIDLTLFQQTSTDILVNRPLAPSSGFEAVRVNSGEMVNKGIELVVKATPVQTKNFMWDLLLNFSKYNNVVKKLAEGVTAISIEEAFNGAGAYAIVDQPYGVLYGTLWQRNKDGKLIIGTNGLPLVQDQTGNIGNPYPQWTAGFRNNLEFKGFTFSFLIDIRHGGDIWNGTYARLSRIGKTAESADRNRTYIIDGVKEDKITPNDKVISANAYYSTYLGDGGAFATENAVQDGSWVRLRDLSLFYRYKLKAGKCPVSSIDIGYTGRNLWLKTKYKGVDPETSLTGGSSNIGGFDYFNNPGTKGHLISLKINF
jgi:TonB-linked SusC/RagA family outer membrane protein